MKKQLIRETENDDKNNYFDRGFVHGDCLRSLASSPNAVAKDLINHREINIT